MNARYYLDVNDIWGGGHLGEDIPVALFWFEEPAASSKSALQCNSDIRVLTYVPESRNFSIVNPSLSNKLSPELKFILPDHTDGLPFEKRPGSPRGFVRKRPSVAQRRARRHPNWLPLWRIHSRHLHHCLPSNSWSYLTTSLPERCGGRVRMTDSCASTGTSSNTDKE